MSENRKKGMEWKADLRSLNNTYNYLPANSPLRPTTLLALLSVLALSSDLEALPLSSTYLSTSLNQWAIPTTEKITFLTNAAEVYQSASLVSKALESNLVALNIEVSEKVVERAVALTLANDKRFDLGDVLKTPGVTGQLKGKSAEVVRLFTDADELEAVSQGQKWAQDNSSYITSFGACCLILPLSPVCTPLTLDAGIPQFTPELLVRKLRLIALTTLCGRSASKQVSYSEVAQALSVPETEVEAWVIDGQSRNQACRLVTRADSSSAIRADLIKARLSQPASLIKIQSVSSAGTRRFGPTEWQTLERRLQEWKKSVSEARSVIAEAEAVAAQGPITHQRRGGGQGQGQQQRRDEEVAA